MCDKLRLGVALHKFDNLLMAEDFVYHAGTIPKHHIAACFFIQVAPQVDVRREDDRLFLRNTFDDMDGIGGGAADICKRFQFSAAIDIAYHHVVRVAFFEFAKNRSGAGVSQATARLEVRQQHFFVGRQHFGRFGHKMHTREDDDIGIRFGSLLAQAEAVAYIIRDILNIRILIIMRQNDSIFLLLETLNLCHQVQFRINIYIQKAFLVQIFLSECQCAHVHKFYLRKIMPAHVPDITPAWPKGFKYFGDQGRQSTQMTSLSF